MNKESPPTKVEARPPSKGRASTDTTVLLGKSHAALIVASRARVLPQENHCDLGITDDGQAVGS